MRTVLVYHNPSREMLPAPPVGLGYVASATADAGHAVRFLDLSRRRDPAGTLAAELRREPAEVVAFSVRNLDNTIRQRLESHLHLHDELIAVARRAGAKSVVGGPAVTLLGAASLDVLAADHAVLGEGEEAFPALLAALAAGREPRDVPGVAWRDATGTPRATPARRLARFGASGLERWIDWAPYRRAGFTWPIQGKRGCGLGCVYCSYPALEGRQHRFREPGEIVDEIERVARVARPRAFEIVDSTFNVPVEPALALCREIRRRRLRVDLTAMGVNPLGAPEELFAEMAAAGFNSAMITPESASERMLVSLGKGFERDAVERAAGAIRRSRIACAWFFLLGGPGESEETVEETLHFIERRLDWDRCLTIVFTGIRLPAGDAARRRRDRRGAARRRPRLLAVALLPLPAGARELDPAADQRDDRAAARTWCMRARASSPRRGSRPSSGFAPPVRRGAALLALRAALSRLPPVRALRQRFPFVGQVGA